MGEDHGRPIRVAGGRGFELALAAVFLFFAVVLEQVSTSGLLTNGDRSLLGWITDHRASQVTDIFRWVTVLGNGFVVAAIVAAAAVVLFVAHRRELAALVVAVPIVTSLLTTLTKSLVGRPRPPVHARLVSVSGAAFPSGHASSSVACYVTLSAVLCLISPPGWRRVTAIGIGSLLALAVSFSRVYLGVHWLSDVVGGWLLGAGVLLAVVAAWRALRHRRAQTSRADDRADVVAPHFTG